MPEPSFAVRAESPPAETLLCGFAEYGLAGLTAADYLTDRLELAPTGHVAASGVPTLAPFEDGTPRRHTRLFAGEDAPTVLLGELPIPPGAGEPFGRTLVEWAAEAGVEEVVVLSGVPVAHGPDDHRGFYIASEGYQQRHDLGDVTAMRGGFLDGVNGAITSAGMDHGLDTCVFTTPVHAQSPDAEASLRLLDAVAAVHDLDVDTGPLRAFADELARHYAAVAERLNRPDDAAPDDRMYM